MNLYDHSVEALRRVLPGHLRSKWGGQAPTKLQLIREILRQPALAERYYYRKLTRPSHEFGPVGGRTPRSRSPPRHTGFRVRASPDSVAARLKVTAQDLRNSLLAHHEVVDRLGRQVKQLTRHFNASTDNPFQQQVWAKQIAILTAERKATQAAAKATAQQLKNTKRALQASQGKRKRSRSRSRSRSGSGSRSR